MLAFRRIQMCRVSSLLSISILILVGKCNKTGKKSEKKTPDKKALEKELEDAVGTPMAIPKMTGSWADADVSSDEERPATRAPAKTTPTTRAAAAPAKPKPAADNWRANMGQLPPAPAGPDPRAKGGSQNEKGYGKGEKGRDRSNSQLGYNDGGKGNMAFDGKGGKDAKGKGKGAKGIDSNAGKGAKGAEKGSPPPQTPKSQGNNKMATDAKGDTKGDGKNPVTPTAAKKDGEPSTEMGNLSLKDEGAGGKKGGDATSSVPQGSGAPVRVFQSKSTELFSIFLFFPPPHHHPPPDF